MVEKVLHVDASQATALRMTPAGLLIPKQEWFGANFVIEKIAMVQAILVSRQLY